jgi:hypothetical protein
MPVGKARVSSAPFGSLQAKVSNQGLQLIQKENMGFLHEGVSARHCDAYRVTCCGSRPGGRGGCNHVRLDADESGGSGGNSDGGGIGEESGAVRRGSGSGQIVGGDRRW